MEDLCGSIRTVAESTRFTSRGLNQILGRKDTFMNHTVILPKIELPKLDGDVVQWCSFRDMFLSLVHKNHLSQISNVFIF